MNLLLWVSEILSTMTSPSLPGQTNSPRRMYVSFHRIESNSIRFMKIEYFLFKSVLRQYTTPPSPPPRPPFDQNQAPTYVKTPPSPHRLFDLQDSRDDLMHFLPQLAVRFRPPSKTGFIVSAHILTNITVIRLCLGKLLVNQLQVVKRTNTPLISLTNGVVDRPWVFGSWVRSPPSTIIINFSDFPMSNLKNTLPGIPRE